MRGWITAIACLLTAWIAAATGTLELAAGRGQAPAADREAAYRANNVGVAELEQYDYDAAAASFRKALVSTPDLAIARVNLAIALFYSNNPDAALREAQAAAAAMPSAPQPFYMTGLIDRAQDKPDEAVKAFQRVLAIDPADVATKVNLGQVYTQQRNYAAAVSVLREALAAEPYNVTAAYSLAIALTRSGAGDEGRTAMQKFETLRGAPYARTYSQTYLDQGQYAEAIASTGAEPALVDSSPPSVTFVDATAGGITGAARPAAQPNAAASGTVVLADIDGDGSLDLIEAGADGVHLFRNTRGTLGDATAAAGLSDLGPATAALAGDYDNDGHADLLVLREGGNRLLHQRGDGKFEAAANPLPPYASVSRSAAFVDADHDGDLDIFIVGDARRTEVRLKPDATRGDVARADVVSGFSRTSRGNVARAGVVSGFSRTLEDAAPNQLLRNNGNGTFTDVTADAHVADGEAAGIAVVPTDFDNKRDVDLLVARRGAAPRLFQNLRDGSFRDAARETGLPQEGGAVAAGDINKDGYPDFYFTRLDRPGVFALSNGRGGFTVADGPPESAGGIAAQFLDFDNDGLIDLFVLGPGHARLFRNLGTRWQDTSDRAGLDAAALQAPSSNRFVAAAAGDLDGDGDTDLVVRLADGSLRLWRNDGGNRNHAVRARLEGRVSNRSGVGSKIDVRAGSLRQRIETSAAVPPAAPADVMFGLGQRATADVLRVLWPSGTVQAEITPAAPSSAQMQTVVITELNRKPSSCPYLFTWNGERFEFITDFMGGGELGYWEAPGERAQPDPDEYVRIPPGRLKPRNGRYELRVTNELEEVLFVDRLQLVAVDHPDGTAVYPNEGLRPQPPPFALTTTQNAVPPLAAVDDRGRDVLPQLQSIDRKYVDSFATIQPRGYALPHTLALDLGPGPDRAVLLLTGWTDYAFSSDNVAAHQKGLTLQPPSLQVQAADGAWRTLIEDIGIPVGRPQTLVVDLRGKLHGAENVRIVTNMRIYWDQILVDRSGRTAETRISRLDPATAELRRRGFSAEITADGHEPFTYDYTRVSTTSPWKIFSGRYTREGDVRPLVLSTDDMFVVSMPGDELALSFDASSLAPPPVGWTRSFLLYADGFSKEMDINSASPHEVGPLPFHGMRNYPYAAADAPPRTEAYLDYLERYNTRVVRRELPALELAAR